MHEVELQLLTKTAREIPVSLNTAAFMESDSPERRIVAVVRDISERKRAEKERSLLASIVNSSGNAIYSETSDLTITSWNPAAEKLFGYSASEIIGRSAALLAPLDCRAALIEHAHSVRLSGKPENFETRRMRKDGSVIDVAITQSPVMDPSGAVVALSVTAQDISRSQADGGGSGAGARRGPGGRAAEIGIPGQHESRDSHPAQLGHRHDRPPARYRTQPRAARVRP